MSKTLHRPLPEIITRPDVTAGEWSVSDCAPTRGLPHTVISNKRLVAPQGSDPLSQAVRAHEMVHIKVSPQDYTPWVQRGHATYESMIACEEARVNYLATKAGFDMKALADGSEKEAGERLVANEDWEGAVRTAIATLGSNAHRQFITGVRRHNKVWADVLADIGRRAMRELKKHDKRRGKHSLASTAEGVADFTPYGFIYTEMLANWVDRLCGDNPNDRNNNDDNSDDGDTDDSESKDSDTKKEPSDTREPTRDEIKKVVEKYKQMSIADTPIPEWFELVVETCPMPVILNGSMGRKRVASNVGKSPRRLHRYLTDPQRRVFDHTIRGKGGIVLIDCSGSTQISKDQVREVLLNSPSATVVAYTVLSFTRDDNGVLPANAWVLAQNGRMVDEIPFDRGSANAVDLPAVRWAVANRKRREPIIWVTDGGVTGYRDECHDALNIECLEFVKRHGIILASDVSNAIDKLTKLRTGVRPTSDYGMGFDRFVSQVFG